MDALRFDKVLRRVLVVPAVAILLAATALFVQMREANTTVTTIQGVDSAVTDLIQIERLMDDAESGLRGFQSTGAAVFLEPYHAALPQIPQRFDHLRAATANRGVLAQDLVAERETIDGLQSACDDWRLRFAEPLIGALKAGGTTTDLHLNLSGKALFDSVRRKNVEVLAALDRERDDDLLRWQQQVRRAEVALLVLAIMLGLLIGVFTRRQLRLVSNSFRDSAADLQKRAEELKQSEQKLSTTLESIVDGVITCDAAGRVERMNPVAQKLTGFLQAEAAGRPLAQVLKLLDETTREPVDDLAGDMNHATSYVQSAKANLLVRRDGTECAIEASASPIRDPAGERLGLVLVFRDVTTARKAQAALLMTEKLAVAGRLAATIAHEIHNPLDSVSNLLFLMDGNSTPEETAHFLELARLEIARVTQISRAMLSLYRESKAPVAIDVKEMLESILLLMQRRFADLGVEVQSELPDGLVILGFPAELRQVFTNLLTNAAEASARELPLQFPGGSAATPRGDGSTSPALVTVCATARAASDDPDAARHAEGVLVTITDEGAGIPANVAEHLFQPFFTTKGERGTGLGLWVSRGIMSKQGGSIDFSSSTGAEDHGTTFRVFMASNPVINAGG